VAGGIFLIQDDGQLVEMGQQSYDAEAHLQELLARYPNLLAGDQMNSESPRRWLLVACEVPVPFEGGTSGSLALDHLFLDQNAVPTLVEVKRSSDTRIRREVVAQMLDYAANAVAYWPAEKIRQLFENRCASEGSDPLVTLCDLLGGEADADGFWQKVKTNLQAGRIRLLFVADRIPPELRRIVEFLNEQMDPAEVLAVEISQYVSKERELKALVPRVIGQTGEAQQRKGVATAEGRQWDESSFLAELEARSGPEVSQVARQIVEWARGHLPRFSWGKGIIHGSFTPVLDYQGLPYWPITIYTYGRVETLFQHMLTKRPFDDLAMRQEWMRRLNAISGVSIAPERVNARPSIPLSILVDQAALRQFLAVLEWVVGQITLSASATAPAARDGTGQA